MAERCAAVVVGPGLGRADGTATEVARLVADSPVPVVVDADGLYALGRLEGGRLADSRSSVALTPHDGEFARLVGEPPGPDRIAAARRLASAAAAAAAVGLTTAVAEPGGAGGPGPGGPGGRVLLGRTGTPQLATAGTGDVLSGIIGAMVARGVPAIRGRGARRPRARAGCTPRGTPRDWSPAIFPSSWPGSSPISGCRRPAPALTVMPRPRPRPTGEGR